ncbi:cation-translocating P-type ATPase [Ilyomonas limi]|uniref:Cation-translocating P-type ATPase n=1 Tax=Ilyomonas limi TaxID=2575867 RepID=A0A4U3L5E5_9BACT|nr:cation-translocating P-type ATPase [Ilyomonas limi]TKK68837.1 cation-translocating P-type ATPase [Ilyomonas limi]
MEKINWKVEGMSCTNCALTVHKYLEKQGAQNVKVNFIGGDVSFDKNHNLNEAALQKGINNLGYSIKNDTNNNTAKRFIFKDHLQRFLFCLVFTLPLMLHMVGLHIGILMNPYMQLALTIPVYVVGMSFFGKSAVKSLMKGIPNMNVLIALGATAAFVYSLYGTLSGGGEQYLFYETTAAIITLVFLGNWMEDKSVATTQKALQQLATSQTTIANMIAYDDKHEEHVFPVESSSLHVGDLLLVKSGEQVPIDCKILWGEALVNEAVISGESTPVEKKMNDKLIGGSILESGTVKTYVTAVGEDTVLSNILKMVREAQTEKPPVQQLADKISAVFVPVVVSIAMLTFLGNYFVASVDLGESLLRSIAVLVIACPCAMGLATPAAIAVGLGRAARNGILFKNAKSLEVFKDIKQVVFDKTGTLTTGAFRITDFSIIIQENENTGINTTDLPDNLSTNIIQSSAGNNSKTVDEHTLTAHHSPLTVNEFRRIAFSLEKYYSHPIARCIAKEWKIKGDIRWAKIEEIKGLGIQAVDKEGNQYTAGSYKTVAALTNDNTHNIYITRNNELLGWIDVQDEIRAEAKSVIALLHGKGIKTILLSGDSKVKCEQVAKQLGIDEVIAEQTPAQKVEKIGRYTAQAPTAMVGDGINDAPALAKATVGISLSDAAQIAMQSAQVVLMNHGLKHLPLSLGLGKHTYRTIKSNLAWAFAYNLVAIPVAAFGFLNPTIGALVMGFSDVVLAVNSVRLNWKKVI